MIGVEELRNHISSHLKTNACVVGKNIGFELRDHDVLLVGSVRTYFQKQMAQECLRPIVDDRRIVNALEVAPRQAGHRTTS
ncbi:MAG: BON domain-containing protein [Planctomycetota bacterium]